MRRFVKVALAAALLLMLTAGLRGVATATPAGSVEGSVRADDGEPIVGALVQASSWETGIIAGEARTASDGSYSIGGLAFGGYRVSAEATGYFPQSYKDGAPREVWAVPPGATDNIEFVLAPGSSISGYVCQADGRTPLMGARVTAYMEAGGEWVAVASGYADAKGFYSLTVFLEGGTYRVKAEGAGFAAEWHVAFWETVEASDIRLGRGGYAAGVNINLDAIGFISGTVYDADELAPIAGGHVVAYDNATSLQVAEGFCEPRGGTYFVNLGPGTYRLNAEAAGYVAEWYADVATSRDASPVSVLGQSQEAGIDFTLTPVLGVRTYLATFSGTSVRLNGRLESLGAEEECTTSFIWGTAPGSYTHETPRTGRDSTGFFSFVLEDLDPGTTGYYRARATAEGGIVFGEEVKFRSFDDSAPLVSEVKCFVSGSTATISWTTDEAATSQVDFGLTADYASTTGPQDLQLVTKHRQVLCDLSSRSTYYYRIISRDASGNRAVSEGLTFTADASYHGLASQGAKIAGFAVAAVLGIVLCFLWVRVR